MEEDRVVYVIEDCPEMQRSIRLFLETVGLPGQFFGSAEEFLAAYRPNSHSMACVVVDMRLPGMDGLALQQRLASQGCDLPVIFITAFPETTIAVEGMRKGAVDFLIKPFPMERLLETLEEAFQKSRRSQQTEALRHHLNTILQTLTFRERQVLAHLLKGTEVKQIARQLSITPKTVLKHRLHLFEKFGLSNAVELVQMIHQAGLEEQILAEVSSGKLV